MEFPKLFSDDEFPEQTETETIPLVYPPAKPPKVETVEELFVELMGLNRRLYREVCLLWGSYEMNTWFRNILISDRDDRSGFDPKTFSVLIKLHKLHNKLFGEYEDSQTDVWGKGR
jgi:hypothetical protein